MRTPLIDRRDFLKAAGIGASVHWMPLHLHPYYLETFGCQPSDCPCAASIYPELISLPLYPDLTSDDIAQICFTLKEIIAAPALSGVDFDTVVEQRA